MSQPDDTFARATNVVADFDSPFYAEERQRDVWNEASAIGFQTMLWGGLALACAMTWIGGRPQVGWAAALLAVIAAASWLSLIHANRLGVTGRENTRLNRPRTYLFAVLYLATVAGMLVRSDIELSPSTIAGMVVGAGVVLAAIALVARRARTRSGAED
jgi:hypothetical protein